MRLKPFALFVICLIFSFPVLAQQKGVIKFEKTSHNFGELKEENGKVEAIFPFTNSGKDTLRLVRVKASCGCTTPFWTRDPVPPGGKGFVKATYNPINRPGPFTKGVYVNTDGSPAFQELTIKGRVTPRPKSPKELYPFQEGNIRLKTNHITIGDMYNDEKKVGSTVLYNSGIHPIKIIASDTNLPHYLSFYLMEEELTLEPGQTIELKIEYDAEGKRDWGFVFENFYLPTDDPQKPNKRINVSATINERFKLSGQERARAPKVKIDRSWHDFGKVEQGRMLETELEVTNIGKSDLYIRKVSADCKCTKVIVPAYQLVPGESMQVKIRFNTAGRLYKQQKEITLITNDPSLPEYRIKIIADIVKPGVLDQKD